MDIKERFPPLFFLLIFALIVHNAKGQDMTSYLKQNAIRIDNPNKLSDSVYRMLSPFQVLMIGEMHGTKEPANFVIGLTDLLTSHGDSVQVGLELPSEQMAKFLDSPSDSSVYLSNFFFNPPSETGRETFAWAKIISTFKNNPRVRLFFYDINKGEPSDNLGRDSTMYVKVKKQIMKHPGWKIVTISGNVHNMTSPQFEIGRNTMASFLKRDNDLDISARICSINHSYSSGTALNTYGDGLKIHRLGSRPSIYATAIPFDSYIVLEPPAEAQNTPYSYVSSTTQKK